MDTMTHADAAQEYLRTAAPLEMRPNVSVMPDGSFSAHCYYPKGDCSRDTFCHGAAGTLDAAVQKMLTEIEKAKLVTPVLRTAAQCKEAVLNLIREHDAAPASFRDAVDALPVKG